MTEGDAGDVLRHPVVVAAFSGWNDAADAATAAIEHLELVWAARPLAALDPDPYYDYTVSRPTVTLIDGVTRRIEWPTTRLSQAAPPDADRDIVLVRGPEPNMRWREFAADLLELATAFGAEMVVTLGALLSDTPHSRPVPLTGTATTPELATRLGVEGSRHEGPTGIVGVLLEACRDRGLVGVSYWAHVPHYVAQPPCPKATMALLRRLEDLLDVPVPLADLTEQARAWELGVDELAREDGEIAEYVASLESRSDSTELPEATGEQIARDFERYLRRRGGDATS